MKAHVIHVNDMPNYPDAIYIGRAMPRRKLKASPFANPYKIGAPAAHWGQQDPITREGALFGYVTDLWEHKRHLLAELPALRGKPLACWCRHAGVSMTNGSTLPGPDNRCHGDLLVGYLDQWTDDELRRLATGEEPHEIAEGRVPRKDGEP